jgi:hypothetical protein
MNTRTTSLPSPAVSYDETTFRRLFNKEPFFIDHDLVGHPLFTLPRIIQLARSLPEDRVEYNAGNLPISQDPQKTPRTGLSVEETIQRIEECRSWMVLKNVETDPDYRELLQACLAPFEPLVSPMRGQEAFVFVSSPGSITPFHIDPECNFLLQIRGTKTVRLFPMPDEELLTEVELERFYAGGTRNLVCRDEEGKKARVYELAPGQGLHFPVTMPHWVQNGPEVSISFSVTFRTAETDRREILYRIHHRLRKMGITPPRVGAYPWRDQSLFLAFDAVRRAKKLLTGRSQDARPKY